MSRPATRRQAEQRGSVTAWMMLMPILIMLLGGFTVDLWLAASTRARLAAIADDAAAAGASAIDERAIRLGTTQLDVGQARLTALRIVAEHPDEHLVGGQQISATAERVQVTLTGTAELQLLRMIAPAAIPIRVTGAARPLVREGP